MITLDYVINTLSITILVVLIAYGIILLKRGTGRGFYAIREGIKFILLPFVVMMLWIGFLGFVVYPLSYIVIIGFLTNFIIYLLMSQTEFFYGAIAQLDCLGRFDLYFHKYLEKSEIVKNVKLYYYREFELDVKSLLINVKSEIESRIGPNKSEENNKQNEEIIKSIVKLIEEFENFNIFYLFYYDIRELIRGKKCVVYISEEKIPHTRKIEGSLIRYEKKMKFFESKHQVFILFAGNNPSQELLNILEKNAVTLTNVLANTKDIRDLPVYKRQLELSEGRTDDILNILMTEHQKNIMLKEALGQKTDNSDNLSQKTFIKYLAGLGIIFMIPVVILMFIIIFMVL